jgi:hypothetical protein
MGVKFTNNGEGTLVAGINTTVTTLTLNSGEGAKFPVCSAGPTDFFYATLIDISGNREIIKVTQRTGDVFNVIEREVDDSTASAFSADDKVQLRLPKIVLEAFRDDTATNASGVAANLAAIGTNDTDIAALQARDTADEQVLYAPTGITMYIYNPAGEIPTGWSAKSGPADCLLAIAGGAQDYNVAGENLAGSWTPTTHVHTGPSHVHTMGTHLHQVPSHLHTTSGHTLSAAEMPAHNHIQSYAENVAVGGSYYGITAIAGVKKMEGSTPSTSKLPYTSTSGSGSSHTHGNTGSKVATNTDAVDPGDTNASGTANTGTSSAPSTDRPYAAVGLLIERD